MTVAPFVHDGMPARVVFGWGARDRLAGELDRLGVTQVVLIASGSTRPAADAVAALLDHRLTWRVDGVRPDVPADLVEEVTADALRVGADGVVTLGGGSVTGVGKAVARAGLALVAVPTTYAGSEMTPAWAVSEGGRRVRGRDLRVLPRTVVYDPELTCTLPPLVTAASGMNALAHCLEALWAPGASPLSGPLALDGARTLTEGLPGALADPTGTKARSRILAAAAQGGTAMAATGAGAGLHHRLCQVLADRFRLPEAQTHAALLHHVVAFNEPALGAMAARMAVAVGAGRASAGVHDLAVRLGLAVALADLDMPRAAVDEVAAEVAADPPPNPRPVDETGLRALLDRAWEGDGPA